MEDAFVSEAIAPEHDTGYFDCGVAFLDTWLHQHALHAERMGTARTFVWQQDQKVLAYFSLVASLLQRDELPKSVGRGSPSSVPVILIARLALHRDLQGQALGGQLLISSLRRARKASELVGARFVLVDAIDDAATKFYEHYGFKCLPDSRRLVQKLSDVRAGLG